VKTELDAVTVEIIRNAFNAAADEMGVDLARSSYSPVIYEMKDYSVAIFDAERLLLGQSPGLPIFLGGLEDAINVTIARYGRDHMRPGDVYVVNDSYLVGSHLNDVSVFKPVFVNSELVGFAATKTHWVDIGAKEGGHTYSATEIFQEGYRLGPTCVMRAGRWNREMLELLERNSRMPVNVKGDLESQIASCSTGERRLTEIHRRFGTDVVNAAAADIFEQCERLDRRAVAALPKGTWQAEGYMDDDGNEHEPIKVKVTLTIRDSDVYIDLAGSAPQTTGCLNCGFSQTVSAARLAFKFLVNPAVPVSGGTFRCLHVSAPPRTLFSAEEPAACMQYYPALGLVIDLVIRLMSNVMPERVTAAQCASPQNLSFYGIDPASGRSWVIGEAIAVGWGASQQLDGESALANYGAGDLKNFPVEFIETRYPLRALKYQLVPDSGGAGRRRGGLALLREFELLDNSQVSLWFERSLTGPWGVFGGEQGATPMGELRRPGQSNLTALKYSHVPSPAGSVIHVITGGGGGYGDPKQRERELVESDVADGYVSEDAARRLYGYGSTADC
jgi:N-methylhydantoinase B